MKRAALWRISVATSREAEDAVAEMLGAVTGKPATSYFDFETGVSTDAVYCNTKPEGNIREKISAGLAQIKKCGLKIGVGKIKITKLRREDWAESWKRHFKPLEIGRALLIKPTWSKKRPGRGQAVAVLDPGLSFGTGRHPTTAFCLREIVKCYSIDAERRQSSRTLDATKSFLDIGCGSGILAIAAAKLGFAPVHAFDFDANAVEIARANARVNGVAGKIRFGRGDVAELPTRPARKYDLVCANLISDVLIAERRRIVAQLNRRGRLALAGILKSGFRDVQVAFEDWGLKLVDSKIEMEWRSGSFRMA